MINQIARYLGCVSVLYHYNTIQINSLHKDEEGGHRPWGTFTKRKKREIYRHFKVVGV